MKVGFIGVGTMGAGMAANLQKAGHQLIIHDARSQSAAPHIARGAQWVTSPKAVAEAAEVIFLSLPGPPEVQAVSTDAEGLLAGMKPGSVCFDLSTNSPSVVRRLHAIYAEKGCHFLDAPVSGGPAGANSGKLAIWVGGDEAVFNQHRALLDAMGDAVRYIGPIGAGAIAKLVHNAAGYSVQTALAEVFTMGVKAGVEPVALWQAVRSGAQGRARTFDRLADQFLINTYEPPNFTLRLGHKDMTLATDLAREIGVPMRIASIAHAELTEGLNRGWGEKSSRMPMLLQCERAGVTMDGDPAAIKAIIQGEAKERKG